MKLEQRLRNIRIQQGLSQEELAEAMNVSRQTISKWETGAVRPSARNLTRLGQVFGLSVDVLLQEDDLPDPPPGPETEAAVQPPQPDLPEPEPPASEPAKPDRRRNRRLTVLALAVFAIEVAVAVLLSPEWAARSVPQGTSGGEVTSFASAGKQLFPSPADYFRSYFDNLPPERLANLDPRAFPALQERILAAREKIIYGGQSWTVDGALSLVDLETGTVTQLPEFSELFPGWDLPPDKAGEPIQKDEITKEEQGVNANLYLNTESGFGPVSQFALFWGSGKTVTITPRTAPSDDSRCNLGVYSLTRQSTLGWAFGIPYQGFSLQVNTQAGEHYSLRGNAGEIRGFRHIRVAGAMPVGEEP